MGCRRLFQSDTVEGVVLLLLLLAHGWSLIRRLGFHITWLESFYFPSSSSRIFFFFLSSFALTNTGAKNKKLKSRVKLETEEFFRNKKQPVRNGKNLCSSFSRRLFLARTNTKRSQKDLCLLLLLFLFLPAARFFLFFKDNKFQRRPRAVAKTPTRGGRRKRENLTVRRVRSGGCWCWEKGPDSFFSSRRPPLSFMHTVRLLSSLAGLAMQTAVYNMQLQPCRFNPAAAAPTHTRTHGRSLCPCRPKTKRGTSLSIIGESIAQIPVHPFTFFVVSICPFFFFSLPQPVSRYLQ